MGVNYGANKVRFTSAVPSGSQVRMRASLMEADLMRRVLKPAEFKKWFKPAHLEWITRFIQVPDNFLYILMYVMGKHEFIMEFGAPSDQSVFIRFVPEFGDQSADQ